MDVQTKLVKDGNSWAVRLPKAVLKMSGLKGGEAVKISVRQNRIIIRPARSKKSHQDDRFEQARQDAKQVWQTAFDDVWLETFGVDE